MAPKGNTKLVFFSFLLLTIAFQTLTITLSVNADTSASTANPTTNLIANTLKAMAKKRFDINENEFNQTKKSFRRLIERPDIDNIVKNVSKLYPGNSKKQSVEAMDIVVKNNPFLFPKLRSFAAFDWLMRFIHQVNVGKSKLPIDGTLYRCFRARYPACLQEAATSKLALLLQKYECAYRFYTDCEYEDYRFAMRRSLPLLDFNALN